MNAPHTQRNMCALEWASSHACRAGRGPPQRTRQMSGTRTRSAPLSNRRSLRMVSSVFRMALFALKTSSMNATLAAGR